ncbi:hypothetical protein PMIN04_009567 [Paraphaeosphaeria minitans]
MVMAVIMAVIMRKQSGMQARLHDGHGGGEWCANCLEVRRCTAVLLVRDWWTGGAGRRAVGKARRSRWERNPSTPSLSGDDVVRRERERVAPKTGSLPDASTNAGA